MIILLFSLLIGLVLGFIALGLYAESPFLGIIGYTLLFMISFNVLTSGIEYATGENTTYNYNNTTLTLTTATDINTTYTNHTLMILFAAIGVLGFAFTLSTMRRKQ